MANWASEAMRLDHAANRSREWVQRGWLCSHPIAAIGEMFDLNSRPTGHKVCTRCGCCDPISRSLIQRVYVAYSRLWRLVMRTVDPRGPKGK